MRKEIEVYNKGYRVTEKGNVISNKGNDLKLCKAGDYLIFAFRDIDGANRKVKVHRLQAFQKYGMKLFDDGVVVRHTNGVATDNSYDNILIGTQSQNMMDIPESIRKARSLHATSFIRKYEKDKIKKYHLENESSYKDTMNHFNITSKGTLHYILNS